LFMANEGSARIPFSGRENDRETRTVDEGKRKKTAIGGKSGSYRWKKCCIYACWEERRHFSGADKSGPIN